jgi:transcriptional regulator with XRE-family HTH domain
VAGARSPTVRRRELGALLRNMRTEAQLTVEQVADALLISPSKVSRLETGQRGASARDIRDLCDLYGLSDSDLREHLGVLAREGKEQAWWQPFDLTYATYVGLEAAATSIRDFEPGVFPGLLQTPGYARAVHEGAVPRPSPEAIGQQIEVRRTRQLILTREDAPQLSAVMDEAVLHRVVGSPAVMASQIDRLIEASAQPNVTVQVIPFSAGAHPALDSTFILLDFAPPVSAVVYVEGLAGHMYLEAPRDVQRYAQVFDRLREISLSKQQSLDLFAQMSEAYKHQEVK